MKIVNRESNDFVHHFANIGLSASVHTAAAAVFVFSLAIT